MSPFIFLCPGDSQPVCSSSFSYNHSYGFIAGFVYHHRCFDICWEILRHLLAPEAPNTFNASIQTFYLDGVDIGYPCFHDICSAIPKPNDCVLFYGLFLLVTICGQKIGIWRKFQQKIVPCYQNRAMQIQRLTKPLSIVSVVTLSSLRGFCTTQHIFDVLHDFGFAHIFFQFFCQFYGVRIENSWVWASSKFAMF